MADVIEIVQGTATVVEVAGPTGPQGPAGAAGATGAQGPQGVPGTGLEVLTTQGDILYQGASTGQRLPIGTTGQVLKVAGGIPSWANESGAVTSVNGATGAVTVAAEQHASEHEPSSSDTIYAFAALVTTDVLALNGVYFCDGATTVGGKDVFFKTGTRKNTKLQYNSSTLRWNLVANLTIEAESSEDAYNEPWGQGWIGLATPTTVSVTRLPLETMVQKLAETGGTATATTSEDGLMSSSDKTKLNGIAAGAEVNVQANWTEADSGSDAFIQNKPATFAPSAHSSSHASTGSDPLFDQDLNTTDSPAFSNITAYGGDITIGDLGGYGGISGFGNTIDIEQGLINGFSIITSDDSSEIFNEIDSTKKAKFSAANIATGTTRTFSFPNADGTFALSGDAPASHAHGNLTNDGKLGSTSGLPVVTTTAGAVTTLALGTAGQVLTVNSGATGVEFAAASGGGVTGAASSASDVLGVSGSNITGVDANADRIIFFDDSAGKLTHLTVGSGLSLTDTTLTATGGGVTTGSVDNAVLRADGIGGSTSQGSAITIGDEIRTFSITGDATADTITATGSGFANGQRVRITSLTGGSGLSTGNYFVINVSGATFQVSTTEGGSASLFTTNITAGTLINGHFTQQHTQVANTGSDTDIPIVITPKGTGAFIVGPPPDGTSVGGNARGANAICMVRNRTSANQVASGSGAIAIGDRAQAGGSGAIVLGASYCGGTNGIAMGFGSGTVSSNFIIALGDTATVNAADGMAFGRSASNAHVNAICMGQNIGTRGRASFDTASFGAVYWGGSTTNNTATILNLDATATNRLVIGANTALAVDILLVARRSDVADKWLVARRFLGIRRDGSNNTSLIGAVQTVVPDQSAGSPTWTFALTADDTNEALQLEVTGATGETVQWRALAMIRSV